MANAEDLMRRNVKFQTFVLIDHVKTYSSALPKVLSSSLLFLSLLLLPFFNKKLGKLALFDPTVFCPHSFIGQIFIRF